MDQIEVQLQSLLLDPENPRLPESLQGKSDEDIKEYLSMNENLQELVDSFAQNDFFPAERLLVLPAAANGKHIVVEGNRRLAALQLMAEGVATPEQEGADGLWAPSPTDEIPCLLLPDRASVNSYLAYRHIGGPKTWPAEAKARFLTKEVESLHCSGDASAYFTAGRRMGSNARGVRSSVSAFRLLRYAHSEHRIATEYVQFGRFGVWLRCMNSPEIRNYIVFNNPSEYSDLAAALGGVDEVKLRELIRDLTPVQGERFALIRDSRQITDYGRILVHDRANRLLRETLNIESARSIVDSVSLPQRLHNISRSVQAAMNDIVEMNVDLAQDLRDALPHATSLKNHAQATKATIETKIEEFEGQEDGV